MYETIFDPVRKLMRCAFEIEVFSATDPRVKKRLDTCDGCSHLKRRGGVRQCRLCNCFVACKARVPNEECPVGKWKAEAATLTVSGRTLESVQEGPH